MFVRLIQRGMLALMCVAGLMSSAQAHWMVAQRGTLNLAGDGAYMVLSLPVSALKAVDDDHDGLLSAAELQAHAAGIEQQIRQGVHLRDGGGARTLQGVMLQLSPLDHVGAQGANQVLVMGKFALGVQRTDLRFKMSLFGQTDNERSQEITVSRGSEVQRMVLTPGHDVGEVLPSAWGTVSDYVHQGMAHVLDGPDHLLFLLVVLASGWGLRKVVSALTCFTLGHGLTLAASALGGLSVPSTIVEPAIAATIVGMVLVDRWSKQQAIQGRSAVSERLRLALVFGCALIHGLGLAGALHDMGLDTGHRLWSLLGFNLGVELAQIGVACASGFLLLAVARAGGPMVRSMVAQTASIAAIGLGSFWFIQRLVESA